jgi:hypothetical protein
MALIVAAAESFFGNYKSEQIKKQIYSTRLKPSQKSSIAPRVSTLVFGAASISTSSAPMSSRSSVKPRYKKCLVNWGNAT